MLLFFGFGDTSVAASRTEDASDERRGVSPPVLEPIESPAG
jgi:hypothetical protein